MLSRKTLPIWIGVIVLSGMFLMGQEGWGPAPCTDLDGDGYGSPASSGCTQPQLDCDDDNPDVNPGEPEGPFGDATCGDAIDNDCDSDVDSGDSGCCECIDGDSDGYGDPACENCTSPELDCDDGDPNANPGEPEGPFGDATCGDGIDNDCNGTADGLEPTCDPEDLNMTEGDFECVLNWDQPDVYRLTNKRGHLAEALLVAQSPTGGEFPPGTVIQVTPVEAMVKRAPGWNPATNDWEFFSLSVSALGTQILGRGGEEATNGQGQTCFSCHSQADPQWDLICRKTHGCDPLPLTDQFLELTQQNDPRCP